MRTRLDEELREMNKEMLKMAALCEKAISCADKALLSQEREQAEIAIDLQEDFKQKEKNLENLCLKILLLEQPMALDLRQVSAALKMITDLRRIGEIAGDMGDIIRYLNDEDHLEYLTSMASSASSMVTNAINAFVQKDVNLARKVISSDDIIDDLFLEERNEIINMIQETPQKSAYAIDLVMIAKYYEKIGDHAVNLAEWVIYFLTGNRERES